MIHFEERPWGSFEKFHENRSCTVKLIHVNANCRLSLQYHEERSEFWQVVKGEAIVELDGRIAILKEGESIEIPKLANGSKTLQKMHAINLSFWQREKNMKINVLMQLSNVHMANLVLPVCEQI